MLTIKDYEKNSNALDYFQVDWSDWLGTDTIATSEWTVPTGLTKEDETFDNTRAIIWLSGGTETSTYKVVNHITTALGDEEDAVLIIKITNISNVEHLLTYLRLRIGDTDSASYRYTTDWLYKSLEAAVQILGKWWNFKYLFDTDGNIYRNPNGYFIMANPPILEGSDGQIIVLMAAYIVLEGSLENSAWDYGSWKDAEISFSNIESSRARKDTVERLRIELLEMIKPPSKRLARVLKSSLPGFKSSTYEYSGDA